MKAYWLFFNQCKIIFNPESRIPNPESRIPSPEPRTLNLDPSASVPADRYVQAHGCYKHRDLQHVA